MPDVSHDVLVGWQRQLEQRLERFADDELRRATSRVSAPGVHDAAAAYLTRPSKRLMGMAFLHAAWALGVREPQEHLTEVATALEIRHGAVLLHDDIVDGDAMRGGQPTAHCALAGAFGAAEARSAAVFAGDVLAGVAPLPITRCGLSPAVRLRLVELFSESTALVAAGQIEQLSLDVRRPVGDTTQAEILRVHAGQFVPYLMCSVDLAGALAGLDDATMTVVHRWATPMCQAFQVQNDVAGFVELRRVLAAGEATGSALTMANTSDLARRRRTVVVRAALDLLPAVDRQRLVEFLADERAATEDDLRAVVRVIDGCGAVDRCTALVESLWRQTLDEGDVELPAGVASALVATWRYMQALYDPCSSVSRLYMRARPDMAVGC